MSRSLHVALLGPIQQENLPLQYLAASLVQAGHTAEVIGYNDRADLDASIEATLRAEPAVVGVGIPFQNNIEDALVLIRSLRERGYEGHITCGGHVPTFCYEELLRDLPGLDSAVRHEAEHTIVELVECVADGRPVRDIAGVAWRQEGAVELGPTRPPLVNPDELPIPVRSPEPYLVGGIVVDFLITARGCVGECNYCSIAAFNAEGGVPFRLRQPEPVVEEIAVQYKARGARVFFVQDDLFILPSEKKTIDRVNRIRDGLRKHGIEDVVFWIKGRPETITDAVCAAAREMGAIHMFTGVENASGERLKYLGRTHLPIHNDSAIARCRAHDIMPSFNFMLFDPDTQLEDIEDTLALASRHLDLPWNVCRTEVYSGTRLRHRLAKEGRLQGDYRSYGYRMADPRAEVMFRIMRVALHQHALAVDSLLNRLISLSFARQLHNCFFPGPVSRDLDAAVHALGVEARADTLKVLRDAMAFVASADLDDKEGVRRYAVAQGLSLNMRDMPRRKLANKLWAQLNARGVALMAARGAPTAIRARSGFGVAAGS